MQNKKSSKSENTILISSFGVVMWCYLSVHHKYFPPGVSNGADISGGIGYRLSEARDIDNYRQSDLYW